MLLFGYLSSFGPFPWRATEHAVAGGLFLGMMMTVGRLHAENTLWNKRTNPESIGECEREDHVRRLERLRSRLTDFELSLADEK